MFYESKFAIMGSCSRKLFFNKCYLHSCIPGDLLCNRDLTKYTEQEHGADQRKRILVLPSFKTEQGCD